MEQSEIIEKVPPRDVVEAEIRERLVKGAPDLFQQFPFQHYIDAFDGLCEYSSYGTIPSEVSRWCRAIRNQFSVEILEDYHCLLLLTLIDRFDMRRAKRVYPESILRLYDHYFHALVVQMSRNPQGRYVFENDMFVKDLAVCRQKLVPCGAQLVDLYSGVPRSIAWGEGAGQILRILRFFAGRVGGFRPMYQMHMDPRLVLEFHPMGWERCYQRIAELLDVNPNILGVFGSSWWFDPKLEEVSPRLAFIRKLPQLNGAQVFRIGEDLASTNNALANSKPRQALHRQGKYRPINYLLIWRRNDLIAWAREKSK